MRKYILFMVMATCSGTVWAADFVDTAKVVSSTPILERVSEPRQECWNETVSSTGAVTKSAPVEEHSVGGALLGGVIGGVVGSQKLLVYWTFPRSCILWQKMPGTGKIP